MNPVNEVDGYLSAFAERRFDMQIEEIEVCSGERILLRSKHGRLYGTPQKKLLLEFSAPPIPGSFPMDILGSRSGLTITGKGPNGWHFSTFLFMVVPMALTDENLVEWRAETLETVLRRKFSAAFAQLEYFGLIDQLDGGFENGSVRLNEFGKETQSLHWLQVVGGSASVAIYRGERSWSTVQAKTARAAPADFQTEITAMLKGLSLRMGKRVEPFCAYLKHVDSEQMFFSGFNFSRPPHSGLQPLIPLILDDKFGSFFIALARDFFLKQPDSKIIDLLFSVWDAEIVSRENHRLQTAIALEALATVINKSKKGEPKTEIQKKMKEEEEQFSALKKAALKLLKPLGPIDGKAGHVQRLINLVQRSQLNDAGPRIQAAAESLGLSFSDEEMNLWRKMRNPAAHGDAQDFDEHETDFFACLSMLYRLILGFIGWTGPRVKHGKFDKTHVPYRSSKPITQVFRTSEIKNLKRVVKPGESF